MDAKKAYDAVEIVLHSFISSLLEGSTFLFLRIGRFTPGSFEKGKFLSCARKRITVSWSCTPLPSHNADNTSPALRRTRSEDIVGSSTL